MEKVLIVAKTHMDSNYICIGGLHLRASQNIRLMLPGFGNRNNNHLADTPFNVGQIWDLEMRPAAHTKPPHVEDIIVTAQNYLEKQANMSERLLQHLQPWKGDLTQIFGGCLQITENSCHIAQKGNVPSDSTGYWLTPTPLRLRRYKNTTTEAYYHPLSSYKNQLYPSTIKIKYVGCVDPLPEIPANTLIRVSLARWWAPKGVSEERCYLQISGWYL